MLNFRQLVCELLYSELDTGSIIYNPNPDEKFPKRLGDVQNNYIKILEPDMKFYDSGGKNSLNIRSLTKKTQVFYGYKVYSKSKNRQYSRQIYASLKATGNEIDNLPYKDDDYKRDLHYLTPENYKEIVEKAVDAFVEKIEWSYDFIAYPSSRSTHVKHIAELLDQKLKAKAHQKFDGLRKQRMLDCKIVTIPKLVVSFESFFESKSIFDKNALTNHFIRLVTNQPDVNLDAEALEELKTIVKDYINDRLLKIVIKHENSPISTASHIRVVNLTDFFKSLVQLLNSADSPIPALSGKLKEIKIGGHLDEYTTSHFVVDDLKNKVLTKAKDLFDKTNNEKLTVRILFVDDNINTGDFYKQLTAFWNTLPYESQKKIDATFFFLIRSQDFHEKAKLKK